MIFFLIVAVIVAAVVCVTYLDIKKNNTGEKLMKNPAISGTKVPDEKSPDEAASPEGNTSISDDVANRENAYSQEEYPLSRGETGRLKSIDVEKSEIVVTVDDKDYTVVITPASEIFYQGSKSTLPEIKKDTLVSVFGREKAEKSDTFVADSVYVNDVAPEPISMESQETE